MATDVGCHSSAAGVLDCFRHVAGVFPGREIVADRSGNPVGPAGRDMTGSACGPGTARDPAVGIRHARGVLYGTSDNLPIFCPVHS